MVLLGICNVEHVEEIAVELCSVECMYVYTLDSGQWKQQKLDWTLSTTVSAIILVPVQR